MKKASITKAIVLLALAGRASGDVTFSTVVLTGDAATGLSGVTYKFVSDARVSSAGDVVFWAELTGTGITSLNESSIWRRSGPALSLVLREGDPAPTLPGMVFAAVPRPSMNDAGVLGLVAVVSPPDETSTPIADGVFVIDGTGVHLVALEGTQAAGLPAGTNYAGFSAMTLTPDGRAVWQGNAGSAVWQGSAAVPAAAIAVRGNTYAGIPDVLDYIDLPGNAPAGASIFRATTTRGTDRGVGIWEAGAAAPVALRGNAITGAPPGVVYQDLAMGPLACAGDCVAFFAQASGAGVTSVNDGVLVAGSASGPAMVLREGDPAPGTGATIGTLSPQVEITQDGEAVVQATLTGAGATPDTAGALYFVNGGTPSLVAREGDVAPGLGGAVLYAGFGPVAVSGHGVLAYVADLRGGDVQVGTNRALFVREQSGRVTMLVRTGMLFDPGSGGRKVEEIVLDSDVAGAGNGAVADVAGGGLLVFKLHFKDTGAGGAVVRSSGLFTARVTGGVCYANCDGSTATPVLNVADFTCFLRSFAAGDAYANCDGSTAIPVLNVADFTCFLQKFAAGCQ